MLTITPNFAYAYKKIPNQPSKTNNSQVSANSVPPSFGLYYPSKPNRYYIPKLVNLIKSDEVKTIALFPHRTLDGDCTASCIALKRIIEMTTGKKVDIFTDKDLEKQMKLIDTNNDIKVISNILGPDYTYEQFRKQFGEHDLSIGMDNPGSTQFPDLFFDIFKQSKYTAKIDHHPAEKRDKIRNYAKINLVDTTKDAAAQLVMEFVNPFGIKESEISSFISDPILQGVHTDTQQLMYVNNLKTYIDVSVLRKTSDYERIVKAFRKISKQDSIDSDFLSNSKKYANNGKIAYIIIDNTGDKKFSDTASKRALYGLPDDEEVEYYFFVKQNKDFVTASIRSNTMPLDILKTIGANGRDHAYGLKIKNKPADEVANLIISKLVMNEK